ncbi:MAG: glycosyltransferase family 39 protein [Pirellulales bacterium]|nr:glycosyltransferase family 39 protein [Pirellulales bacterium]
MKSSVDGMADVAGGGRWWGELEFGLLLLLVVAIYFTRISDLSVRGEEPRRARVAVEMLESGDWLIPRQQGLPFLSRPPLGSWVIAWAGMLHGEIDTFATRFPSLLATLLTACLVYWYGRTFMSATGALASGVAYATFGQILQIGRLAETEATFTLLVAMSMLIWHYGYMRGWNSALAFSAGYVLAALGALAKGPQAPVYFAGSVVIYLLVVRRDWRTLLGWGHFVGLGAFAVVLGAWQVPMWRELGTDAVWAVWNGDVKMRFADMSWTTIVLHLVTYPLEILGCTAPWSVFLLVYTKRSFRGNLGPALPSVLFLVTCLAVTFPSCWLTPGARGRYFMPMYPCLALLCGLAVERCAAVARDYEWQRLWKVFLGGFAGLMVLGALVIAGASLFGTSNETPLAQPAAWAVVFVVASLSTAVVCIVALRRHDAMSGRQGIVAVGLYVGLIFTIVVLNEAIVASEDTAGSVARLKHELPGDVELVSLGQIHHNFAFHYRQRIPVVSRPETSADVPAEVDFFCINQNGGEQIELPFAWEPVATIVCDRRRRDDPQELVIVGRRMASERAEVETATRPTNAR